MADTMLTLTDPLTRMTVHLNLAHITHVVEVQDEVGNEIVEVFFVNGHREVYGALVAAPLVAWVTRNGQG